MWQVVPQQINYRLKPKHSGLRLSYNRRLRRYADWVIYIYIYIVTSYIYIYGLSLDSHSVGRLHFIAIDICTMWELRSSHVPRLRRGCNGGADRPKKASIRSCIAQYFFFFGRRTRRVLTSLHFLCSVCWLTHWPRACMHRIRCCWCAADGTRWWTNPEARHRNNIEARSK